MEREDRSSGLPLRLLAGAAAALVAFSIARALEAPGHNVLQEAPPEIIGRWTTDDPRYADRAFSILPDEFRLEVGGDSVLVYRLEEIRRAEDDGFDTYRVTYHTREGEAEQEFRLYPDGTLRLKNPPDVRWTRR